MMFGNEGGRTASRLLRWAGDPMVRAVNLLGICQIISWGTSFYILGVLGGPIAQDTGWSRSLVYGGMTTGLLASALVSTPIGRAIDRHGARGLMTAGSFLTALALAGMAMARSELAYLATWAVLGVALRLTLYDAAFTALVQTVPHRGRRAISYLTLYGGFASSVFWPAAHVLCGAYGWRGTVMVFAAINLAVAMPLAWLALAPAGGIDAEETAVPASRPPTAAGLPDLSDRDRLLAIALFSLMMCGNAFVFGALSAHLVDVIREAGVVTGVAVALAALKGVAQVAGRIWEILFAQAMSAVAVGRVAIGLLPFAFLALVFGPDGMATALAFTLLLGLSNGIVTIVRGAVPLAIFGSQGYGALLGKLAAPQLILNALAPMAFAAIVDRWGGATGIATLLAAAVVSMAAMEGLALWYRRRAQG